VLSNQDAIDQAHRKQQEYFASQWNQHFEALKDYVAENGHAQVTLNENKTLHRFVDRQRQKRDELPPERVRQLEAIGMTWCVREQEWDENDHSLLIWIKTQRAVRWGKKLPSMSKEREEKLEQIGFVWDSRGEGWNLRYQELEEYIKVHGHCCVPLKCQKYPILANWVDVQRHEFKNLSTGTRSSMTEERMELLTKVGFVFSYRDAQWNKKYDQLKAFIELNHGRHPTSKTNSSLHSWLLKQLKFARRKLQGEKTPLTDERAMKLRAIGCLENTL
jgi:hypothetical protein